MRIGWYPGKAVFLSFLSLVFSIQSLLAQVSINIDASRTSGTAPLAVFFDATETTGLANDDYVNAHFLWNFGDSESKQQTAKGFVAAHVFESPGTYTVGVNAVDTAGRTGSGTVVINVSGFSGTTYCVSNSGTDASCAPGATALSTMSDVISRMTSNTRFLFKRGDRFEFSQQVQPETGTANLEFAAYGSGAKPKFVPTASYVFQPHSGVSDWRIIDIELDGEGVSEAQALRSGTQNIRNILFLRVDIHHIARAVNFQGVLNGPLFIFDSALHDFTIHDIYYHSYYLALVNNTIGETDSHNMYLANLYKGVITGNVLGRRANAHILRISNSGQDEGMLSGDVVVSDNYFYGEDETWIALHLGLNSARACCEGTCTSEDNCPQYINNVLIERNKFFYGHISGYQIYVGGGYKNLTIRNNILESQVEGPIGIMIDDHNSRYESGISILSGVASRNINILNNTIISRDPEPLIQVNNFANEGETVVGEPKNHEDISIKNNILYSEAGGNKDAIAFESQEILDELTIDSNLYYFPGNSAWENEATAKDVHKATGNPLFVDLNVGSTVLEDNNLQLREGSPAINAGADLSGLVREDHSGTARPQGAGWDIGAYEYNEGGASEVKPMPPGSLRVQ
jgi:hypothetical protein